MIVRLTKIFYKGDSSKAHGLTSVGDNEVSTLKFLITYYDLSSC